MELEMTVKTKASTDKVIVASVGVMISPTVRVPRQAVGPNLSHGPSGRQVTLCQGQSGSTSGSVSSVVRP